MSWGVDRDIFGYLTSLVIKMMRFEIINKIKKIITEEEYNVIRITHNNE